MDFDTDIIELKLSGNSIAPNSFSYQEIDTVLSSFVTAICASVIQENRVLKKESIIISLVSIEKGSARYKFTFNLIPLVIPAFMLITNAVKNNNYKTLPRESTESLRDISRFIKKKNCTAEFIASNEGSIELISAKLTPEDVIEIPIAADIKGETTLYGVLVAIGGASSPTAKIRPLNDGSIITCDISEADARKVAPKLYQIIGLRGEAKWNISDFTMESFFVTEVLNYADHKVQDAVKALSEPLRDSWDKITNVDSALSELRGEDEE